MAKTPSTRTTQFVTLHLVRCDDQTTCNARQSPRIFRNTRNRGRTLRLRSDRLPLWTPNQNRGVPKIKQSRNPTAIACYSDRLESQARILGPKPTPSKGSSKITENISSKKIYPTECRAIQRM